MTVEQTQRTEQTGIGISPDYIKDWTIQDAIREILQNYVDSMKEFNCEGYVEWEDRRAIVHDDGPGLEPRHLVMGVSEKSKSAIGQFGEGLKLSLLVFAREGLEVEVRARGKKITPEIVYNPTFDTETIQLNIEEAEHTEGTTIEFQCSRNQLVSAQRKFLRFAKKLDKDFQWIEDGFISLPGGKIWVNGSLVGTIKNAYYSYHLDGEDAQEIVSRDRESINMDLLIDLIVDKIGKCDNIDTIKEILALIQNKPDSWEYDSLRLYSSTIAPGNRSLWSAAAAEVFGENVVISCDSAATNQLAEYHGADGLVRTGKWRWDDLLKDLGIPDADDYIQSLTDKKQIAEDLTTDEEETLQRAIDMVEEHYTSCGEVKVVEEFLGRPDARGSYDRTESIIYIKRERLHNFDDTLETLLHEAVHKASGHDDCTMGFERELTRAAAMFLRELS